MTYSLPATVRFGDVDLSVTQHNGKGWLTAPDLARALGYADVRAVTKIYNRQKDEFSADMAEVVNMTTSGNLKKSVRIFSARGCHLVAMFARTPRAKAFRRWVLDVLDRLFEPVSATASDADRSRFLLTVYADGRTPDIEPLGGSKRVVDISDACDVSRIVATDLNRKSASLVVYAALNRMMLP